MKNKYLFFTEENKLKEFEKISDRVSDRYVPIYTSEVVENLSPEFEFVSGTKFSSTHSQHIISMKVGNSFVTIANSYDRSRAFSLYLTSGNMQIPLNLEKQVHIGQNASRLTSDFKLNKPEIMDAIQHAEEIVNKLQCTIAVPKIKKEILSIIFTNPMRRKGFEELDLAMDYMYIDVYKYINEAIDKYIDGDYNIVIKNKSNQEVIRKGRKVKSRFTKVIIMNKVFNYIKTELPEVTF